MLRCLVSAFPKNCILLFDRLVVIILSDIKVNAGELHALILDQHYFFWLCASHASITLSFCSILQVDLTKLQLWCLLLSLMIYFVHKFPFFAELDRLGWVVEWIWHSKGNLNQYVKSHLLFKIEAFWLSSGSNCWCSFILHLLFGMDVIFEFHVHVAIYAWQISLILLDNFTEVLVSRINI